MFAPFKPTIPSSIREFFNAKRDETATQISLPPIQVHDIESLEGKPGRRLKQLVKLNHANYSIIYNNLTFFNHVSHLLSTAYLFGGDADYLHQLYDAESQELEPWVSSPAEITDEDWTEYLGNRNYQRAYLDFFEDELVSLGYDWKTVVVDYLYSHKIPLINSLIAGFGHPLIHLGYAFEMSSREIGMEALAMTASCYDDIYRLPEDAPDPSKHVSQSPFELMDMIHNDTRFNGLFESPGGDNVETLFKSHGSLLHEYWQAWGVSEFTLTEQFEATQKLAATLLVTRPKDQSHDFFFVHFLTTNHALHVLVSTLPRKLHLTLLRQWWLLAIAMYIAQLRPKIDSDDIKAFDTQGRDWAWVGNHALTSSKATGAHYVKPLRVLREASSTWGDKDGFFLKSALKFIDEFREFGGFGG